MREVGIYHDKDLEGLMCGAIMKLRYPDTHLIGWDYGYNHADLLAQIKELDPVKVIMADMSLPNDLMQEIAEQCLFVWIDHHKTAIEHIDRSKIYDYKLDVMYSACELCWEYFFPGNRMPELVRCLGVYDTWRKAGDWDNYILPVQLYFQQSGRFSVDALLRRLEFDNGVDEALQIGRAYMEFEQSQFEQAYKYRWIAQLLDCEEMIVINNSIINPGRFRDFCQKKNSKTDIVCVFYQVNPEQWKYSLRSNDVDVSIIASHYGGGGHKNAAGFVLNYNLFQP